MRQGRGGQRSKKCKYYYTRYSFSRVPIFIYMSTYGRIVAINDQCN